MIHDDVQKGIPLVDYSDTQANIESISSPVAGMRAYATDLGLSGHYNGTSWVWGEWNNWTPTFPTGTMYLTSPTISIARYFVSGSAVFISTAFNGTLSGTTANSFLLSFPFSVNITETPLFTNAHSTSWGIKGFVVASGVNLQVLSEDYSNMALGVDKFFRINCFGRIN